MTLAESRALPVKAPITLVKLILPQCANEYGSAPCTATGGACYYTYETCEDRANFDETETTLKFSGNAEPLLKGALPYLSKKVEHPTEVQSDKHTTILERVSLTLLDDRYHPLACANKTTSPVETAGTFWRNLFERYADYFRTGRVEIYEGYAGLAESAFELIYKGRLYTREDQDGQVQIVSRDLTSVLDVELPREPGDDNLLTAIYNGGASMYVTDASKFDATGCVVIGSEYITYTGLNTTTDTLTGCTAGAYGTTPASHAIGSVVTPHLVFCGTTLAADMKAAKAYHELLYLGGLDCLDIETATELDIKLAEDLSISETALVAYDGDDAAALPLDGCHVRINDEIIWVSAATGSSCSMLRAQLGTVEAEHSDNDPIYLLRADHEFAYWGGGRTVYRDLDKPKKIADLLKEFRASTGLRVWQGKDCKIHCKLLRPAFDVSALATLTDVKNILDRPRKLIRGDDKIITRGYIYYDPNDNDPGEDSDNFDGRMLYVFGAEELATGQNEVLSVKIFAPWLRDQSQAREVISKYVSRYRRGLRRLKLSLGVQDSGYDIGDCVNVQTDLLVNPDGSTRAAEPYEIVKRSPAAFGADYELEPTEQSGSYGVWAPATVPIYVLASEDERRRYVFWADADGLVNYLPGKVYY